MGIFYNPPQPQQRPRRVVPTSVLPPVTGSFTAGAVIKRTQFADTEASSAFVSPTPFGFGSIAEEERIAQAFSPSVSGNLSQLRVSLNRAGGTPVDNALVELWSDAGSTPGSLIASLTSISGASLSASVYTDFVVNLNIPVAVGTRYWIVFRRSGALDPVSYGVRSYIPSVYANGYSYYDTGVWTAESTAGSLFFVADVAYKFTAGAVIKRTYQPYQAQVRADTPNAYWRLGEASGFPQDSSGGAHNATATGGTPTYGVAGALVRDGNTAITFNGTTNYFDVPDSSGLNFADVLTAECWFKLSDRTVGATQFVRRGGTGAYSFGYAGDAATGFNVANTVFLARTGTGAIASSTQTITDTTTWHHAVVTKNGSTVKIYIDGVEGTNVNNPQTLIDVSATLRIGANQGGSEFFEGTLDELALYNYALTQTQVSEHYRLGTTGSGPFYADAVLAAGGPVTVTGSFTANAVIKRTQIGAFTANATINAVAVWTTPANAASISSTPVLTFLMPLSSRDMHFEIQIDDNSGFTSPDIFKSHSNLTGWEYWNGSSWTAIPQSGVPAAFGGNEARYTVQTPLTGTIYRRVRAGQI